jgi:aspartate/methionine/tyrosine aminotransferase
VRIPSRAAGIAPAQFDLLNARAAELRAQGRSVISLGQAVPGFGPPAAALQAFTAAVTDPAAHVYSADAGLPSLRRALCERLRAAHGIDAAEDEVIITAGGNQAFMLALLTLVDTGDEVLLPAPYFVNHHMAVTAAGAVPREAPLRESAGFAAEWEDIEPQLSSRTRAVVLCSPSNPTGAVVRERDLARIASGLSARGILLFSDETYARFVYDRSFCSLGALPAWRDLGVVVGTFSKSFGMTGWRVGYFLAGRDVCDTAIRIQDAMIICAPVPAQMGVEAAVRDAWDYPDRFLPALVQRRALLEAELRTVPGLRWTPTAGGFFAFVGVAGVSDSAALAGDILETQGVVTVPGSTFGRSGEGFLRLSYAAASADEIVSAAARLRAYFGG